MKNSSDDLPRHSERPTSDADSVAIMRWMEEDFSRALLDGIRSTSSSEEHGEDGEGPSEEEVTSTEDE